MEQGRGRLSYLARKENNKMKMLFTLPDQNYKTVKVPDIKGKKILLSFHPLAWTGVCSKQMQSLERNYAALKKLNTVAFGLSVDPSPSKKAWAKSLGILKTRLLSDFWPHGAFAKSLRIFLAKDGVSARANFILDERGKVIFKKIYPMSQLPDMKEITGFLKGKST